MGSRNDGHGRCDLTHRYPKIIGRDGAYLLGQGFRCSRHTQALHWQNMSRVLSFGSEGTLKDQTRLPLLLLVKWLRGLKLRAADRPKFIVMNNNRFALKDSS